IGLFGGTEIPLDLGLKLNGRERGLSFGALGVRTGTAGGALDTLSTRNSMSVVRLKQNVLGESSIGAIVTTGDPLGRKGAWLAAPHLTLQTSRFRGDKNFLVGVWGLAMDRDSLSGRKRAWGGKIDYPNDLWDIASTYKRLR